MTIINNLKNSLTGWRTILNMPNPLVHLINIVCIGVGFGLWTAYTTYLAYGGLVLIAVGIIGILDAVYGRVTA